MPTYQYRCRDCGEELEVVQSFTDKPKTRCPACKGSLRKVFAAPGISFKGSGFYKNDSRGGTMSAAKGEAKGDAKSESSTGTGDSTEKGAKKEAKADAKADAKAAATSTT